MADNNIAGASLSLMPNMTADLEVKGLYARTEPYEIRDENGNVVPKTLKRGFYVEDEDAGIIEEIEGTEGRAIVRYRQLKARENTVWFVSLFEVDGEPIKGAFRSIYVPVHDHSSIVAGGPAYGTYRSEGYRDVQQEGA
jgi:hypothetical protein